MMIPMRERTSLKRAIDKWSRHLTSGKAENHRYSRRHLNRATALVALVLFLVGCARDLTPMERAAGSWPGQFVAESAAGSTARSELDKWTMKGTLWLYVTDDKFRLEMETANQEFTVKGKWEAKGDRVTLRSEDYDFTFPKEEDQEALKLAVVSADAIRKTFHQPLVLNESNDRRTLKGLKISLGPLVGSYEFERPIPR